MRHIRYSYGYANQKNEQIKGGKNENKLLFTYLLLGNCYYFFFRKKKILQNLAKKNTTLNEVNHILG